MYGRRFWNWRWAEDEQLRCRCAIINAGVRYERLSSRSHGGSDGSWPKLPVSWMPGHAASGAVDWKVNVNDIDLAHDRLGEFVTVVQPIESFGVLSVGRLRTLAVAYFSA
jgi:hypothetical protein